MSWRTSKAGLAARRIGRNLKVNDLIGALLSRRGYEKGYDDLFSAALRPGLCVWDVGANVGHYTLQFAERTGPSGSVIAFEPSPHNFARLEQACAGTANVRLHQMALGRSDGSLPFEQGNDELGATSRVASGSNSGIVVDVRAGRGLVASGLAPRPEAVKIDVEGFELEVLEGLGDLVSDPRLRVIGVEVHFRILEERGQGDVPATIERLLASKGYAITWPDSSHIIATRPSR